LITPCCFYRHPPAVAVATGANQDCESSFSALWVHLKRKDGLICAWAKASCLAGGLVGAAAGCQTIFNYLKSLGPGRSAGKPLLRRFPWIIGGLMLVVAERRCTARKPGKRPPRKKQHVGYKSCQFKMRFRVRALYLGTIPPLLVGPLSGLLAANQWALGAALSWCPRMIYLPGDATKVVVGTSLVQIIFVAAFTTMFTCHHQLYALISCWPRACC